MAGVLGGDAAQFERLLGLSMEFAEYVMGLNVDPDHKQFARILAIKQSVSSSILTATARVRAGLLRPTNDDGLAAVLAEISRNDDELPERGGDGGDGTSEAQADDSAPTEEAEIAALFA